MQHKWQKNHPTSRNESKKTILGFPDITFTFAEN